nr:uncharacterized mitochondrial protein AtMg00810-like [Tanacetum cinerariifolium]
KNSHGKKQKANVSIKEKQKKHQPKVKKPKQVGFIERLATPKPRTSRFLLRWSPTGRLFDQKGKIVDSSESESQSDCSNGYLDLFMVRRLGLFQAHDRKSKASLQFRLEVYGNCHNLFSIGQLYDSNLEVAFRRNACFVRNLEGVNLLKKDRSTNLYTINLHEMASASPICLMARASSTKSWLWHQWLSHLNFDTINDLARNDLVLGLPKFKYNKEYLCPSCEQGKSKRASHPPKPVLNSRQRLHLLHMDLCGLMRIAIINGKRYVLVIVDDYSRYTWVHFLRSKDEAPEDVDELNPNALFDGNTFFNPFASSSTSAVESSSSHNNVKEAMTDPDPHEFQWTKDHPLEQVIGEPSRPVLTRNQLRSDGDMCTYALSVSTMELKNVKEAMTDPAWIQSIHVYKLKKALYGLKQAPRAWYDELSTFLLHNHFFKGTIDPTLFIRRFHDDILVVQVYVDDIIFGSTHPRYIQLFSDLMKSRFEMSMMGEMTFFLGLQVNQSPCGIFINQSKYVLEILNKYGINYCDPVGTPMEMKDKLDLDQNRTPVDATKYHSMIFALMYMTSSRPDIVHATCLCAWYQAKPTEKHLKEVKRIFRYLRGTVNTGIWYSNDSGSELTGFSDADYARCNDTFKSTFGGAQFLGEKLVSWSSKKQDCTALSIAEAEYVSLSACCAQVLWMRTQLTNYGFHFNKIPIYCDSKSAIAISCNPVQHSRTNFGMIAQLGDLKGKSKDTSCVLDTLNLLSQKLKNENVELEFQVLNYAIENAHLKTTYKNLFDSISMSRTQTKTIIASMQHELQDTIYENAKLRAQLFNKVSEQKDVTRGRSVNTMFTKQSILGKPPKVIALGMFRINLFKPSREEKHVPNKVRTSVRTKPINVSQPPVVTKKVVNSDSNGLFSTGIDNTKTRRPQPRSNTKNDRVSSTSKSSRSKNKEVKVEEHHRKLLLSKNKKHMSSECNNVKLAIQNVYSKVICAMCKQCLISVNYDVCLLNYVNDINSRGKKQTANVSIKEKQKKQKPKEAAKFVGDFKSLAKEADESLAKHKALELEIERLLRADVSQDIMSVV